MDLTGWIEPRPHTRGSFSETLRQGKPVTSTSSRRGSAFFEWVNRHIRLVTIVLVVGAFGFLFLGESMKTDEEVSFDPKGELYDTFERAEDLLSPATSVAGAAFLVEDPAGLDVLNRAALLEYLENSAALRADSL